MAPEPLPDAGLSPASRAAARDVVPPVRQASVPPVIPPAAAPPPKRRWWKSLKFLVPLMILAIVVVITIVMLLSTRHTLQGTLQMQGLDGQAELAHSKVVKLRQLASDSRVAQLAIASLKAQDISPGFLADVNEMASISDLQNSQYKAAQSQFVLSHTTTDVPGDSLRMKALLSAIYAESGAGNDSAASLRRTLELDQAKLKEFQNEQARRTVELNNLVAQLSAAGISGVSPALDPTIQIVDAEKADHQRQADLNAAATVVKDRRDALAEAQSLAAPA